MEVPLAVAPLVFQPALMRVGSRLVQLRSEIIATITAESASSQRVTRARNGGGGDGRGLESAGCAVKTADLRWRVVDACEWIAGGEVLAFEMETALLCLLLGVGLMLVWQPRFLQCEHIVQSPVHHVVAPSGVHCKSKSAP